MSSQERQSRKPKSENRFYSFLSRSRSRSRAKDSRLQPDHTATSQGPSNKVVFSDSKPPTRIPSLPISSTTTVTNSTVVPSTAKARAHPVPAPPIPQTSEVIGSDPQMPSKPSGTRRKFHNLFGIPLSGSKKSPFGLAVSQPSSSRSSLDVPPMLMHAATIKSTFKHRKASSHSHNPGVVARAAHKATTSLTDISNVQCPTPATKMFHRIFSGTKVAPPDAALPISVSAPTRRPSQNKSAKSTGKHPLTEKPLPDPTVSTFGAYLPTPPQIVYTPATPERQAATSSSSKTFDARRVSLESGKRNRSTDAKGKEREKQPQRSAKYDAVDPEVGGDPPRNMGAICVQRSESSGTDAFSSLSAWNQHMERARQERDSTFGPGLAGVGTVQKETSLRRGKEWEEQLRTREAERKKLKQQQRKQKNEQESSQDAPTLETEHTGGSSSTVGTGHSSSWGKAAGKRSAMSTKTASGSGIPKLPPRTQHPAFDFEPPIPSSTSRNVSSTGTLHDSPSSTSEKRSDVMWHQKSSPSQERRHSPAPTPAPTTRGHRSALKGRSLDLGLGLAWAPSTVREEALLPSFNVGRSFSQSSSGRSASGSQNTGKSTAPTSNDHAKASNSEDMSKLGREVAAVFKSTLDGDGFTSFKRYVHQFDAHEIPFDGPTGIITRVDQLLGKSSTLKQHEKQELMDQLVRIILRNA